MTPYRFCPVLVLTLIAAGWSGAQNPVPGVKGPASSEPARVRLEVASTVPVPSLASQGLALPVLCTDNTIVAQFVSIMPIDNPKGGRPILQTSTGEFVVISPEGKIVTRLGGEKITDVPSPTPLAAFVVNNDVYVLTESRVPTGQQTNWSTPSGNVVQQAGTKTRLFVAHFKRDGTYVNATLLDLPFSPMQFGVFGDGNFLIAGADRTFNPRIAIVASDGRLLKWVELKGDVHIRAESDSSDDKTALPLSTRDPSKDSLFGAVTRSQIVADGPDLLLFRPSGSSVFSISPGGEVRIVKLDAPADVQIFAVKPAQNSWIVEFSHHDPTLEGLVFDTYAFDRATGRPLIKYSFPNHLGFGLACVDETGAFTFLLSENEANGVKLVKLAPGAPNK